MITYALIATPISQNIVHTKDMHVFVASPDLVNNGGWIEFCFAIPHILLTIDVFCSPVGTLDSMLCH